MLYNATVKQGDGIYTLKGKEQRKMKKKQSEFAKKEQKAKGIREQGAYGEMSRGAGIIDPPNNRPTWSHDFVSHTQ